MAGSRVERQAEGVPLLIHFLPHRLGVGRE
jgi:hypothetical protein